MSQVISKPVLYVVKTIFFTSLILFITACSSSGSTSESSNSRLGSISNIGKVFAYATIDKNRKLKGIASSSVLAPKFKGFENAREKIGVTLNGFKPSYTQLSAKCGGRSSNKSNNAPVCTSLLSQRSNENTVVDVAASLAGVGLTGGLSLLFPGTYKFDKKAQFSQNKLDKIVRDTNLVAYRNMLLQFKNTYPTLGFYFTEAELKEALATSNSTRTLLNRLYNKDSEYVKKAFSSAPSQLIPRLTRADESLLIDLVKINPSVVKYVNSPSKQLIATAKITKAAATRATEIKKEKEKQSAIKDFIQSILDNPRQLSDVSDVPENLQLAVINKRLSNIRYINNPTERVQLMACKKDPNILEYISNPTPRVIRACVGQ